jgi:hypothetical protein
MIEAAKAAAAAAASRVYHAGSVLMPADAAAEGVVTLSELACTLPQLAEHI